MSPRIAGYLLRSPGESVPESPYRRAPNLRNDTANAFLAELDEHQVRRWSFWYRWTTLAMPAAAFLTIAAATEHARRPAPADQIPLTRNEIAGLFSARIIQPASARRHRLRWWTWRRRRQRRAKTCHYQRQARQP